MNSVPIDGRPVGPDAEPYIIAEIGSNHNGDMDLCRRLIDAAAEAGADVAKFQSWSDTSLVSQEEYDNNTSYENTKKHFGTLEEMVAEYQFTPEQHEDIRAYCREQGITFCSTPFSNDEADLLDDLGVPFFKTASMDINHPRFLRHVARKGRPMIVSTGMASLDEIARAVEAIRSEGNDKIVLLHCVAIYPPDPEIVNLRNMDMLADTFDVPVGLSDHSLGVGIPLAAIGRGACVVEKHFTLDKDMAGWDHAVSADPAELDTLVREGKKVHRALGRRRRVVSQAEKDKAKDFRRSLVALADMQAGEVVQEGDFDFKRPGTGIRPDEARYAVGRTLTADVEADHVLRWEHFGEEAPAARSGEAENGEATSPQPAATTGENAI